MDAQRLCPDCSFRTTSPWLSLCPSCNVPLMAAGRILATSERLSRVPGALVAGTEATDELEVAVRDLGPRGARLEHGRPLQPGQSYLLSLLSVDGSRRIELPIRVRRCLPGVRAGQGEAAPMYHSEVEFQHLAATLTHDLTACLGRTGGTCPGPLPGRVAPLPD